MALEDRRLGQSEDFFVYKLQDLAVNLPTNKEKFDSVVAWPARGIVREEHESPFSVPPGVRKSMIWTSPSEDKCNALDVTCLVPEKGYAVPAGRAPQGGVRRLFALSISKQEGFFMRANAIPSSDRKRSGS